jgi:uncharacterized protein YcbX
VTPTVTQIWRRPVKSMQGERLDATPIGDRGVVGDRRWGIRELSSGRVLSAKREGRLLEAEARLAGDQPVVRLPDSTELQGVGPLTDEALSTWLGFGVSLVEAEPNERPRYEMPIDFEDDGSPLYEYGSSVGTFHDSSPVHLLTTASLRAARALHPDGMWDERRFRPTFLLDAAGDEFVEDGWVDAEVGIGMARLRVRRPCERCVMTTRAQPGLPRDLDVLRTLTRSHDGSLGVLAAVVDAGRVAIGDAVTVF